MMKERLLSAQLQERRRIMHSTDIKQWARQIVKNSFNEILDGTFRVPSEELMGSYLEKNFEHSFDEYQVKKKIGRSHIEWTNEQVADELERQKRHFDHERRTNLRIAALNTIEEVENLIRNLNRAINEWKILNL
jgi:RNA processing factor Prp31